MMRRLVLFDVDGTLLWSHGAGRSAIRAALLEELGATGPIDGYRFDGKTDPQIVHDLMAVAGVPLDEPGIMEALFRTYLQLLESELNTSVIVEALPGVPALLDALEAHDAAVLGLLTGNVRDGAALKLRAAGLDPARFHVGAYGSDHAHRPELPAIAVERAAEALGFRPRGDEIVIVGDTPADMTCGDGVGARAIGVCTGSYDGDALFAAGADAVFADLAETDAVVEAMLA
jgi:phosphoglycolate phosphatase-like HAD superfamily hydrolase